MRYRRSLAALSLVFGVAGCSAGDSAGRAEAAAADESPKPTEDTVVDSILDNVKAGELYMAATALDDAPAQAMRRIASRTAKAILACWDAIRIEEMKHAQTMGVDQARGKSRDNCPGCLRFRGLLDKLAPFDTALGEKWKSLRAELEVAEKQAIDAENNDARPKIAVVVEGDAAVMVYTCAVEQLEASYPQYKWIPVFRADQTTAEQPKVRLLAQESKTTYVKSDTHEKTSLISGMRVALVGEHLDPKLAKKFQAPIAAERAVDSPDEIRAPLVGGPETEAVRIGMQQLDGIRDALCGELKKQIAAK